VPTGERGGDGRRNIKQGNRIRVFSGAQSLFTLWTPQVSRGCCLPRGGAFGTSGIAEVGEGAARGCMPESDGWRAGPREPLRISLVDRRGGAPGFHVPQYSRRTSIPSLYVRAQTNGGFPAFLLAASGGVSSGQVS